MASKYSIDAEFICALDRDIITFIDAGIERHDTANKFNELILRLFQYQFNTNLPYQKYCQRRGIVPWEIDSWEQIPAVPTEAFKEVALTTFPAEQAIKVFMTSGTSDQERRGKVYLDEIGLKCLDLAYQRIADGYLFPNKEPLCALLLCPSPQQAPNMGLAYGNWMVLKDHTVGAPECFITPDGLDVPALVSRLKQAEVTGEALFLLGASFGFVNFFDFCHDKGLSFKLPPGSVLADGGGYKGKSREIGKEDFLEMVQQLLGIQQEFMINSLGLSEVSGPFPDNTLRNHVLAVPGPRYKPGLPWTRTIVVDPDTQERLPKGETGLLRHYSLANRSTVLAVQTEDLGYEIGSGFEIIGRVKGAEARGCSIAVDEMISAAESRGVIR